MISIMRRTYASTGERMMGADTFVRINQTTIRWYMNRDMDEVRDQIRQVSRRRGCHEGPASAKALWGTYLSLLEGIYGGHCGPSKEK